MSRTRAYALGTALLVLLTGLLTSACGSEETPTDPPAPAQPDFSKLIPSCFTPHGSNPLIVSGDYAAELGLGTPQWNDPHIIKVGTQYWMYASADDNFNHDIKVYRLVSTDLVNWTVNPTTPVLEKTAAAFDSRSTETPAVVFFQGQYHMFWTGYTDETDISTWKIGHAVSSDGINFTKDVSPLVEPSDPGGAPNLDFDQYLVAEPAPVVFNNQIYLYFAAAGANIGVGTVLHVVGLITSSDGLVWSAPQSVLEPDQTTYPRNAPDYFKGYSTPHAVVLDDEVHLFFDVVRTDAAGTLFNQEKLHHAVSSNGITVWSQDPTHLIDKNDAGWTSVEVRSPAIYLEGTSLTMWYAGHTGLTLGIGLATCAL